MSTEVIFLTSNSSEFAQKCLGSRAVRAEFPVVTGQFEPVVLFRVRRQAGAGQIHRWQRAVAYATPCGQCQVERTNLCTAGINLQTE